jgi:hypothetical protein
VEQGKGKGGSSGTVMVVVENVRKHRGGLQYMPEEYHTLHIFSSSSMRTKLSDRERNSSAGAGARARAGDGTSELGLCTLLIFADYASSYGKWDSNINCVLFFFLLFLSCFSLFLFRLIDRQQAVGGAAPQRIVTGLGRRAGRPLGPRAAGLDRQAK